MDADSTGWTDAINLFSLVLGLAVLVGFVIYWAVQNWKERP